MNSNYCPHHYCSICNADSLYAPQPNGSFPKIHSYLCGSTQLYLESGTQVFTGPGQQISIYTQGL